MWKSWRNSEWKSVHENFLWLRNHFEKNAERIFQCAKYLKISPDRVLRFGFRFGSYWIGSSWVRTQFNEWTVKSCANRYQAIYIYIGTCIYQKITYMRSLCHVCECALSWLILARITRWNGQDSARKIVKTLQQRSLGQCKVFL